MLEALYKDTIQVLRNTRTLDSGGAYTESEVVDSTIIGLIVPVSGKSEFKNSQAAVIETTHRCYTSNDSDVIARDKLRANSGANFITSLPRNSTFEDNATDWATNGNHVVSIDAVTPLAGTYSGKIVASGSGDPFSSFASLAIDKFAVLVNGNKYTFQMEALVTLANTDLTVTIGEQSKVFTAVDNVTKEVLVWNFQATGAEVSQPIKIYLSQAETVVFDEVDLSQAITYEVLYIESSTLGSNPHQEIELNKVN